MNQLIVAMFAMVLMSACSKNEVKHPEQPIESIVIEGQKAKIAHVEIYVSYVNMGDNASFLGCGFSAILKDGTAVTFKKYGSDNKFAHACSQLKAGYQINLNTVKESGLVKLKWVTADGDSIGLL